MTKISYTYKKSKLEDLFYKENEILDKISSYCERTNKSISTKYKLTLNDPLQFILIITIQNEK